ncbi:glycosyltransferase family 39 protein [Desmonostoc muscorum LEGE 12446]|uniref:Glycosyltransferase family 39 protein n=1 Tax=Desmonostoc muscorum LEGE 12446 TaxID=1828758 RepID=A0A8J6ZMQ2_DESMC|nr:glycosyltransferase family 39 protein [Desmonostoc muscorum]MCF2147521.1 glycosyltransferase family 39 protein [Desmonostoc muscorum LEGE 12446]
MRKKFLRYWGISHTWLRFLIILLLVTGVLLRFVNIDRKVYWGDEVFTSLRISGYTLAEMNENLANGRLLNMQDLHKYQYPSPEKNVIDTIKGLALEESQVAPLYFVMARFWVEWFGNSVTVTRSFSVFISLLSFPSFYWLCQELFESSLIAWIAMALVAVSPVHLIYAQDARPYTLWIVTILISSAALLRAMRLKTRGAWTIYALTLPLGFYIHLFFGLVAFAQGIYVVIMERFRLSKTLINYFISLLVGIVSLVPWILVIITNPVEERLNWTDNKQTLLASVIRWVAIISRAFLDLGVAPNDSGPTKILLIPLILIISTLIIYSIYVTCRKTSQRVWLFVLTLSGSLVLPLMLVDFLFQKRYGTTRYILPSLLGIQLAVAYLFSTQIVSISTKGWQKKLSPLLGFIVIIFGVISCTLYSQANMWWSKVPEKYGEYPQIAEIINQSSKPLVIAGDNLKLQVISHQLDPKVQFQLSQIGLTREDKIPEITNGFTDIFLFEPSDFLKAGIERIYNSNLQQINKVFWKLTPKQ